MFLVRFLFDMFEIGGVFLFVLKADFMGYQFDGVAFKIRKFQTLVLKEKRLLNISKVTDFSALLDGFGDFNHGVFAHAIHADVGF